MRAPNPESHPSPEARTRGSRVWRWAQRGLALGLLAACLGGSAGATTLPEIYFPDDPTRDIHLTEAKMHLRAQRFEKAKESLKRSLHEHPNNLGIAYKLADLHFRHGEIEEAQRLIKAYLDRATAQRNLYYPLGLIYLKKGELRNALGAFSRAIQLDPTHLKAYVRLSQIRIKQGLPYDAERVLQRVLELDPEYLPALEEMKIVRRLIERNDKNVYRRRNLVVLFDAHEQLPMIERAFPHLDRLRRRIEADLRYHIPIVWIRVQNKVRRFHNPPAIYDPLEDLVRVEAAEMERGNLAPILHQLAHLYLHKATKGNAPNWLVEGLALFYSRPQFLAREELRTVSPFPIEIPRVPYIERRYLEFEDNPPEMRRELAKAFVLARYLHENYGVVGVRKLIMRHGEGEKDFFQAAKEVLHLDREVLVRRLSLYSIRGHYFHSLRNRIHP